MNACSESAKHLAPGPRCYCGHWAEEHTADGGCAGCDASGQSPDGLCLHGGYKIDPHGEGDLNEVEADTLYEIVRFRFKGENEVIESDVSLEDAQAHCEREDTHGDGWFDGYRAQ